MMKRFPLKYELAIILISGIIFILMIILNDVNMYVRFKELQLFLQRSNASESNNVNHLALVMKYKLHRQMYEKQIKQQDFDLIEMRVKSLLANEQILEKVTDKKYIYLEKPVLVMINGLRYSMGKNPIKNIGDIKSNVYLEIAYYYERNNFYRKALSIYDKAVKESSTDRKTLMNITLHQGFCFSIIGDYDKAKQKYLTLINDFENDDMAIVAATLLRYLEIFKNAADVIKKEKDSVKKGEKLYNIIAYKEALNVFKKIEKKVSPQKKLKLKFLQARCFEALANKKKAFSIYQNIILKKPKSHYARSSNRRIFIMGSVSRKGSKIMKLAINNNRLIKDKVFDKMVQDVKKITHSKKNSSNKIFLLQKNFNIKEDDTFISDENVQTYVSKINKRLGVNTKKKQKVRTYTLRRLRIFTKDGNIFVGTVIKETPDVITLKTLVGRVEIQKSKIKQSIRL